MIHDWKQMDTAPKDGTLVLLIVKQEEHGMDDAIHSRTIGFNNFENDGTDKWLFAGWHWCQDLFVQGTGKPLVWADYPATLQEYSE